MTAEQVRARLLAGNALIGAAVALTDWDERWMALYAAYMERAHGK